jgi:hypothetical protein
VTPSTLVSVKSDSPKRPGSCSWRGIQFDALGPGSVVQNGVVADNVIEAVSGSNNNGIYARGRVNNVQVMNNTVNGIDAGPMFFEGLFSTGGRLHARTAR